ncbi:formate dehydrogenase accessory sulfurtransferase FdhD [Martelella mediterranea]|uniref:Sulfur carrier protein FdhD n=1 Tax=Martelella mediterranea TaxID=293089 RepID=A0A4R3NWF0_9HYPH|nr:FdhD protein [Martelella mediterranea]
MTVWDIQENQTIITFSNAGAHENERAIASEVAIAMSYGGSSHAVMMATPADLEDFAYGFSLSEGIIDHPAQIEAVEVISFDNGVDLQITLSEDRSAALSARRRSMAGPVGCGLCGLESLEAAMRQLPGPVAHGFSITPDQVNEAVNLLTAQQPLFAQTRAVHGAGFYRPESGIAAVREDVGRHNALDKLVGALARSGGDVNGGALVVTSRLSVEMVQKAAIAGAPVLIAISAPTALAIRTAEDAGITLIGMARGDGFSVLSHMDRIRI